MDIGAEYNYYFICNSGFQLVGPDFGPCRSEQFCQCKLTWKIVVNMRYTKTVMLKIGLKIMILLHIYAFEKR